jgi:hypothetical protein
MVICSFMVRAQGFAPTGAKWYYGAGSAFSANTFYLWIESVGDTIVDGRSCRVLINNEGLDCSFHSDPYIVFEEDSAVHFYVPQLDTFQTLFDMKSLPGETWQTVFITNSSFEFDTVVVLVDSIGFDEINGYVLKQLYVSYEIISGENGGMQYPARISERLGDMEYMFRLFTNQMICDGNYSTGLRCYEDAFMGLYSTGISATCDYTGIDDEVINSLKVYPNPTSAVIRVSVEGEREFTAHVMDFTGRNVMIERITDEQVVDISELPDGVYLLRFEREGKQLGQSRIIKAP